MPFLIAKLEGWWSTTFRQIFTFIHCIGVVLVLGSALICTKIRSLNHRVCSKLILLLALLFYSMGKL